MTSAVAPLRYPYFRALWAATIFSATGTFIQTVAGSWLMYELTESSTWVGLMAASSTLPLLFFSLTAGALADMFDRPRIMLVAQLIMGGSALAMAGITYLDLMTPGLLLALGLLLGTGAALNLPAWQALLPELVPRGLVASAVALQSAAFNAARAVGPAIGGALIVAFGPALGFGVNALSYLSVIAVLLVIAPRLVARERNGSVSMSSAISMGIRFARFTPPFRSLLTLVGLFAITSSAVQAILPVHTDTLGGGAGQYGILLGAMGAGALAGAFLRRRLMTATDRNTVPLTIVLFGLSGILLGLAPNLLAAGVGMFFAGMFWLLTLSTLNATAQLMAPEWIRGRAMSLYTLSFAGIMPIGAILSGVVADQLGTSWTLVAFSAGTVLLGLTGTRFRVPRLEDVESPAFSDERVSPPHPETGIEGGPVIVINTWTIDPSDLPRFTEVMNQVRKVRLTTGAYRWRLMVNVSDQERVSELFAIHSWEEHLAQHTRIDDASAALIARARAFDRADGPRTRHLIAIDVDHPPDLLAIAEHEEMHRIDGSIGLPDPDL